ncbi:zinc finger domain-containing protein [Streptomyces olivaceiscleroticus]|uniref:DNA-binding phage zinc finger domain-containing protein n=1 Tax=Streptomyces olivaceiscleroticus TaxID=68245 RepID=A0ABN0ZM61_9ACTN
MSALGIPVRPAVLFDTSALPDASTEPNLPYTENTVTLVHVSREGRITQARRYEEKQALLTCLDAGALIAMWVRQEGVTAYAVNDRTVLGRAMGVHSRTSGRSYRTAPPELEAIREREAVRFERRPCRTCGAQPGEVCRTYVGGVATYYHRGRDGSTSGTAKVPKSRMPRR